MSQSEKLLRDALSCLESGCPPKGGRTDKICRRIRRYLSTRADFYVDQVDLWDSPPLNLDNFKRTLKYLGKVKP